MKKNIKIFFLVGITFVLATGFLGRESKNNPVIATINNKVTITKDDFINRIKAYPGQEATIMSNNSYKDRILNQLIDEELLYLYAKDKGVEKNSDVKRQLEIAKKQILATWILKEEIDKRVNVTEDELRQYYAKNMGEFSAAEERRISHILVSDESTAKDVLKGLKSGESFRGLAEKKSIDPTGRRGGDLGWFTRNGQLVKEFEDVAFSLKKEGDISDVVKTQFGYHIIRLDGVSARKKIDYSAAKPRIQELIKMQKQEAVVKKLLEDLRKKAKITTDLSKLTK